MSRRSSKRFSRRLISLKPGTVKEASGKTNSHSTTFARSFARSETRLLLKIMKLLPDQLLGGMPQMDEEQTKLGGEGDEAHGVDHRLDDAGRADRP